MRERDIILIVDDTKVSRYLLRSLFEKDFDILEAENGAQALLLMEQYREGIACVLLDLNMPQKDGYQVLAELGQKRLLSKVPVVVITGMVTPEVELRAFDLGAMDIVQKPFEPLLVERRVKNVVELSRHRRHLEQVVEEQAETLRESNEAVVDVLSSIIEYRSLESGQHILRIRMFTKILLEAIAHSHQEYGLNEEKIDVISSAASMHDIGKIAIPDCVLNKPGKLTDEEFEVMKSHATKGCEMLDGLGQVSDKQYLQYAYNICRYHHERWDGRGYPDGLRGDNIPICAQAVGVADCYDALTNDRVYKKAYSHEQAVNMILNGECGSFSPKLLECLKNVREQFSELARQYADGHSPRQDVVRAKPASIDWREKGLDPLQFAEVKYYTLLRYVNANIIEVDMDSGIYHIVYAATPGLDLMRAGSSFRQAMERFAKSSVHPEDQESVLAHIKQYREDFFSSGLMNRTHRYRVRERWEEHYRWYRATMLRVGVEDPSQHKLIVVWEPEDQALARHSNQVEGCVEEVLHSLLGGLCKCRNDKNLTVVQVNEAFTDLLGYTKGDLEQRFGGSFAAIIQPEDRARVERRVQEQLRHGTVVELEYGICGQDGAVHWILDKTRLVSEADGEEYLYSSLLDITRSKRAQEALRLSLERHQLIMDQSNDIIFEWDMEADTIEFSANWEKKFGYTPMRESISQKLPVASHLYPDDVQTVLKHMLALRDGASYGEVELRIATADGRYLWCRVRATAQADGGRNTKAVGVVQDIDGEKRATQALQERAERDSLTRLYNKNSARARIEEYLTARQADEIGAMLIIDVDNFKYVNDRYGHMFGDAVLTEISTEIRKLFRNADIISRIGGDEFMVFLKAIPSAEVVAERAGRLVATFQGMFQERLEECKLSCSVGVALVPNHGTFYQELFQRADRALYQAKSQGKDRYVVYDRATMEENLPLAQTEEHGMAVGARIDSDDQSGKQLDTLLHFAFRQLYESGDAEEAVNSILALVGRQFNVSRAYIFENTPDGKACCNTFEWCNNDVLPQKEELQYVRYSEDLEGEYEKNFNENGIFYCPDVAGLPQKQYEILKPQAVKSMLQCAILDGGHFRGFVGFDECSTSRMWTQEQIDSLTFLSELLSIFLLKKRVQDEVEAGAEDLRMAMDHQNTWIYIIDPDTFELRFINAKTRAIAPEVQVGSCCYQAFFDRESPCEQCPAAGIRKRINCTMEIYNPKLDVWSSADASLMRWGGREACLLSCHDITRYKK